MPKANLYPAGSANPNWLLLTFHPDTNETKTVTLGQVSNTSASSLQNKGAVSGAVSFDLATYSDFILSIANDITASFSTPTTPSYVLIEVIHTAAGKTITNLPGTFDEDFAWATGAGEVTLLVGRFNGLGWMWSSSRYTAASTLPAPTSFVATAGDTLVNLSWLAVFMADGYVIDRATNAGFTTGVALGIYSGNGTAYSDTGRTNGTTYYYRIRTTAAGSPDSGYATANATPSVGGSGGGVVIDDAMIGTAAADLLSHTPTTGGALSKVWGTTGVAVTNGDGTAKSVTPFSTLADYTYAAVYSGADQKITCRLKKLGNTPTSGDFDVVELYLRADTSGGTATGYYIQLIDGGLPTGLVMGLHKKIGGVNTEIGAAVSVNYIIDNALHDVSIEVTGSTIITRVDGLIKHSVTDTSLTAGRKAVLGFYSVSPSTNQFIVDNFKAEDGPVVSAIIVSDDFNGTTTTDLASHTPEAGGAITKAFSSTGVAVAYGDGTARGSAPYSTVVYYAYAAVFSGANQKITARVKKAGPSISQLDDLEIYLRCDTSIAGATGYYIQLIDAADAPAATLNKKINGVNTEIGAAVSIPYIDDGNYHTVQIQIIGNSITTRIDGAVIHTATDSALTAGRKAVIAFYNTVASVNQFVVDSFLAENI